MANPVFEEIFGKCDPVFEKLTRDILDLVDLSGKSKDEYKLACDAFEKRQYTNEECWAILMHYEEPTEVDWDDAEYRFFQDCMRWIKKALEELS